MHWSWKRTLAVLAVAGMASCPGVSWGQDEPQDTETSVLEVVLAAQEAPPAVEKPLPASEAQGAAAAPASEYWIGVQLEPLPEIITSQLKLERGMVVVRVFEDSPAAKAELKTNDIILRAGDKDVKGPEDLISAVNEAQEKQLEIVALRGGTETTLRVTPTKRSPEQTEVLNPGYQRVIVQTIDELLQKQTPDGELHMLAVRPGAVYAYTQATKFPSDLEVTIEKRGDKPATIRVTRVQEGADKTWEVTEDKIGELPDDVRIHVQQIVGGGQMLLPRQVRGLRLDAAAARVREQTGEAQAEAKRAQERAERTIKEYHLKVQPVPRVEYRAVPAAPAAPSPPIAAVPRGEGNIQAKLDAILKKLDREQNGTLERLEKELEKLRKDVEALRQEKK